MLSPKSHESTSASGDEANPFDEVHDHRPLRQPTMELDRYWNGFSETLPNFGTSTSTLSTLRPEMRNASFDWQRRDSSKSEKGGRHVNFTADSLALPEEYEDDNGPSDSASTTHQRPTLSPANSSGSSAITTDTWNTNGDSSTSSTTRQFKRGIPDMRLWGPASVAGKLLPMSKPQSRRNSAFKRKDSRGSGQDTETPQEKASETQHKSSLPATGTVRPELLPPQSIEKDSRRHKVSDNISPHPPISPWLSDWEQYPSSVVDDTLTTADHDTPDHPDVHGHSWSTSDATRPVSAKSEDKSRKRHPRSLSESFRPQSKGFVDLITAERTISPSAPPTPATEIPPRQRPKGFFRRLLSRDWHPAGKEIPQKQDGPQRPPTSRKPSIASTRPSKKTISFVHKSPISSLNGPTEDEIERDKKRSRRGGRRQSPFRKSDASKIAGTSPRSSSQSTEGEYFRIMDAAKRSQTTKALHFVPPNLKRVNTPPQSMEDCRVLNKAKARGFSVDKPHSPVEGMGNWDSDALLMPQTSVTPDSGDSLPNEKDGWDRQCEPPAPREKDFYRARMDEILNDVDMDMDEFDWVIPEHLPNSPLCPLHPNNKSRSIGICVYHGRRTSGNNFA